MNKRQAGNFGEDQAVMYLIQMGYRILDRNYRCRQGEVDIVAKDGNCLVFVEVKYRSGSAWGDPAEAVNGTKQRKIYYASRYYLYQHQYGEDQPCRFDVVSVYGNGQVRCIRNAFGQ